MTNVLVYPSNTQSGIEICKSLYNTHNLNLLLGDNNDPRHSGISSGTWLYIPSLHEDSFDSALNKISHTLDIDFVFPTHDEAIFPMLMEFGEDRVISCTLDTVPIVSSKKLTYASLMSRIDCPERTTKFPMFVKPSGGRGSVGAHVVYNQGHLDEVVAQTIDPVITEYLPGPEYTTDCLSSRDGKLLYTCTRRRGRVRGGITTDASIDARPDFAEIATNITQSMLTMRGPWFFQTKERANGDLVLLEVNCRVSGTMCMTRSTGVNIPLLSLMSFRGQEVVIPTGQPLTTISRYFSEIHNIPSKDVKCIIWDLDDTIVAGQYNPDLNDSYTILPWAYECLYEANKAGIYNYLLTRNEWSPCPSLFEETTHCSVFSEKSTHIQRIMDCHELSEENILFIDDSFTERRKVNDHLPGILTLDPRNIHDGWLVTLIRRQHENNSLGRV